MAQISIKKSLAWSFMQQGSVKAISLIVQIVLARLLLPEAFGVMAILLVVVNVADSIAQSGLGAALIQGSDTDDLSYTTAFWLSITLAFLIYLVVLLGAPVVASFYGMPTLTLYLRVLGFTILLNSFNSIQRSYLQREMNFKTLCIVSFIAVLFSGLLGVLLALFGAGIWALVLQNISASFFTCLLLRRYVRWRPSLAFNRQKARHLWSYGWKICVTGILNVCYTGISELIIGKACDPASLGYYSQGRKYPNQAIGLITAAVSNVLFPTFSRVKEDCDLFRQHAKKALDVGTFIIAPISIILMIIAEPVILLLLTDKWLPCVLIFQLTLLPNAILMFQLVNLRAYMALGDSALYMRINVIKIVAGGFVICMTALITKDIYATAAATCLAEVCGIFFVDMVPAKRMYGYSAWMQVKSQLPTYCAVAIAVGVSLLCSLIPVSVYLQAIMEIVVFAATYLVLSRLFRLNGFIICLNTLRSILERRNR